MGFKRQLHIIFIILLLWQNQSAIAQSQSSLEKRAHQAFVQKNYNAALVDYRQLLAKDQQNPTFNFCYGVCIYEVEDHFASAKYFDVILGLQQEIDPLVYFYRARIYHEQYFFKQALSFYEKYQQTAAGTKNPMDVNEAIQQCQRALAEVQSFVRLPLLEVKTFQGKKFYTDYPFNSDDYTFYEAPEVHSKNNAKHGFVPIYAYKRGMKYRILASYGPKGDQLDLYLQRKDADNNWAALELIGGEVNQPQSAETFGFYDAASQTLYFSSTAKSIGGHDLYKASFDLSKNQAASIEKMPYPYSSPTDDLFYVCDATQNQAYFATARQGKVGQYEIYTLQLDRPAAPNFVFAGLFLNELDPNSKDISVQFTDQRTQEVFGPFVSDPDGAYQIALPLKGEFLLEVLVKGASQTYQTRFSIPVLKPQTALRQQVRYFVDEMGKEQWQVLNQIVELDAQEQLASLSKLQLNVAKGSLLQAKRDLSVSTNMETTFADNWGFGSADTASFIALMTDSLLAAEVSLENQVRLMELLRQDFERQLNARELLLAKLSRLAQTPGLEQERNALLKELEEVEQALAFNRRWIEINQAANIPDLVLLDTLRAINERNQALIITGDSSALVASWTARKTALQQYLQIAAFDGASAFEAAALQQQQRVQQIIKEEAAIKAQQEQIAQQIKQLQTDLTLQTKKEQAQTQLKISTLERDQQQLAVVSKQLRTSREAEAAQLKVYDQQARKEMFVTAAENQQLPEVNLQSTYEELLAQYAQQEVLSENLKSQIANSNKASNNSSNLTNSNQEIVQENSNETSNNSSNQTNSNQEIVQENSNETSNNSSNPTNSNQEIVQEISNEASNNNQANSNQEIVQENSNEASNNSSNQTNLNQEIVQENSNQEIRPEINNGSSNTISNQGSNEEGNAANRSILIEEKIAQFEMQINALKELNLDEIPAQLPKVERLGLTNEALVALDEDLTLPKASVAATPTTDGRVTELTTEQEIQAYIDYVTKRQSYEQTKAELVQNQAEIRTLETNFDPKQTEQLAYLLSSQVDLQNQLKSQKQALLEFSNQPVLEALLVQNYRPDVDAYAIKAVGTNVGTSENATQAIAFTLQTPAMRAASANSPLPIGLPCPEGLVFRVQVGAFRKQVPAERFREFTPVDGTVLANGLTVYMAGYFRTSQEALQQQAVIRNLGYADAFVVAYQNCNRLSLAQGRELEKNIPNNNVQVAQNSLFAAPGQGLYYTVQVGVYNRPLTSAAQLGLSELIEAKTAKGQYRYASGKFANIKEAKTRQQLAVAKGIKDAFIVAYYQGKRIDLAQAQLLAQSGVAFETNFSNEAKPVLSAQLQQQVQVLQLPEVKTMALPDPICRYERKCDDCSSALSRYNRVGIFIYDSEKELVVSAAQKESEWDLVQLMYLKEMRKKTSPLKGATEILEIEDAQIDGAFIDWLLRQQNGYELSRDADGKLSLKYLVPSQD
ncbi:MAG: hypothetical protein EB003_02620 [Flavobacteriia bacterium]|nr:hypothetical protein [Flavobacteriia bacterium]